MCRSLDVHMLLKYINKHIPSGLVAKLSPIGVADQMFGPSMYIDQIIKPVVGSLSSKYDYRLPSFHTRASMVTDCLPFTGVQVWLPIAFLSRACKYGYRLPSFHTRASMVTDCLPFTRVQVWLPIASLSHVCK